MVQLNCPGCGNPVKFVNASSIYVACDACSAIVVRKDVDVEQIGKVAALQEDGTPLQRGTTGTWAGKSFEVIGRIQNRYADGFWNEWFIHLADGSAAWIGEAMGTYFVSQASHPKSAIAAYNQLKVGTVVEYEGVDYLVTNRIRGRVVSFEGEIPFHVDAYEAPSVDLRSTKRSGATFDYSDDPPLVFVGEYFSFPELNFQNLREAGVQQAGASPTSLKCPKCGAPHTLKGGPRTQVLVCEYCNSAIDVTNPAFKIIWTAESKTKVQPLIPLGKKGKLQGIELECLGFIRRSVNVEGVNYAWSEYLLYNRLYGYRWLTEMDGHWTLMRTLDEVPTDARGALLASPPSFGVIHWNHRTFKHFQDSIGGADYVVGEFYWKLRVGDVASMRDYVDPPYLLSLEQTSEEITWSVGEYMKGKDVWSAFQLPGAAPPAFNVAPNQPNPGGSGGLGKQFGIFAGLALLIMIAFGLISQNRSVWSNQYTYFQDEVEHAKVSEPFVLSGRTSNVVIRINSNLSNRWVYFRMALINDDTHEAIDFGKDLESYSGVDDGEAWSEGSRSGEVVVPMLPAGHYSLFVDPETGSSDLADRNIPLKPGFLPTKALLGFRIEVVRDVQQWNYFWLALLALGVLPFIQWIRVSGFERRRWMQSDHPPVKVSS